MTNLFAYRNQRPPSMEEVMTPFGRELEESMKPLDAMMSDLLVKRMAQATQPLSKRKWFVLDFDNQPFGPFFLADVMQFIGSKALTKDSPIYDEEEGKWNSASYTFEQISQLMNFDNYHLERNDASIQRIDRVRVPHVRCAKDVIWSNIQDLEVSTNDSSYVLYQENLVRTLDPQFFGFSLDSIGENDAMKLESVLEIDDIGLEVLGTKEESRVELNSCGTDMAFDTLAVIDVYDMPKLDDKELRVVANQEECRVDLGTSDSDMEFGCEILDSDDSISHVTRANELEHDIGGDNCGTCYALTDQEEYLGNKSSVGLEFDCMPEMVELKLDSTRILSLDGFDMVQLRKAQIPKLYAWRSHHWRQEILMSLFQGLNLLYSVSIFNFHFHDKALEMPWNFKKRKKGWLGLESSLLVLEGKDSFMEPKGEVSNMNIQIKCCGTEADWMYVIELLNQCSAKMFSSVNCQRIEFEERWSFWCKCTGFNLVECNYGVSSLCWNFKKRKKKLQSMNGPWGQGQSGGDGAIIKQTRLWCNHQAKLVYGAILTLQPLVQEGTEFVRVTWDFHTQCVTWNFRKRKKSAVEEVALSDAVNSLQQQEVSTVLAT